MRTLKCLFVFFAAGLLLIYWSNPVFAQSSNQTNGTQSVRKGERPNIDLKDLSEDAYLKGIIRIKLKDAYAENIDPFKLQSNAKGQRIFGIESIDAMNQTKGVNGIMPLFAALGSEQQKFSSMHKKWGFHLWYTIYLDEKTDIVTAVKDYGKLKEVEAAEPEYKKHQIIGIDKEVLNNARRSDAGQGRNWMPDDEYFGFQWHYHNTGQEAGTQDADIDLPEAWDLATGNQSVIVAIVDGGIDYDHADLAPNMWESIGYNFVNNTSNVIADDHGTHVAGTVAAATGNSIGVAGIAGGSGNSDGVRLMSAQVFSGDNQGGFHLAPIWAADNGAAISQNSWGYNSPGVYNQAELDAIDYFNQNGGGDALLNGGITIFAAGNDNSSLDYYPGYYSGVLSVASTNNQDIRSYYSNYGDWVDISAPGGETNSVGNRGVLSTLPGNGYGFYQGTSMACPHVSGVAALIASLTYGQISNADVWNILVSSTDDIETLNPNYNGQLGSGRLNAYQALTEAMAYLSGIYNPINFSATAQSASAISLNWELNQNSNDVLLITSVDGNFITPLAGESFQVGDNPSEGQEVLFVGNATTFEHLDLSGSTTYYYKLWSVDESLNYSPGVMAQATTFCDTQSLPFAESFDAIDWPSCWSQTIEGASGTAAWIVNASNSAGGQANEMRAQWQNGIGTSRLISPMLDLSGADTAWLLFNYFFDDYRSGCQIKVQTSNDGTNWIDQPFLFESGHGNYGPRTAMVALTNTSNTTNIAWVIDGDQFEFDYWFIDDVTVQTDQPSDSYNVSLSSSPENGGIVAGEGTYLAGEMVMINATPSQDYFFTEWQNEEGNTITYDNPFIFQMPQENISYTAVFRHCSYYPSAYNLSATQITGAHAASLNWEKPELDPDFPTIISSSVYVDGQHLVTTADTFFNFTAIGIGAHEFCIVLNYDDGGSSCYGESCFTFELANEATVNGTVTDLLTAEPIPNATVFLANSNANYSLSTDENGYYESPVLSGIYDFTISASGYVDQFVQGITIAYESTTTHDFQLNEFPYPVSSVILTESEPGVALIEWPLADPGWLHYDDGVNVDGIGGPETFSWAIKFDAAQLIDYQGFMIEKVALYTRTTNPIDIAICEGSNAATVLYEQTIVPQTANNWEIYDLNTAVSFDIAQELWIVCYTAYGTDYPAGCGSHQNEPNGDLISLDGTTWEHLTDYGLNNTWNLQVYVNNGNSQQSIELKKYPYDKHFKADGSLLATSNLKLTTSLAFDKHFANDSRALTGFSVYRSSCYTDEPEWVATTTDRFYVDNNWVNLPYGVYRYGVVAEYDLNQSVIVYSNCMDKDMYTTVDVQVTTNSGDSPEGTMVKFTNISEPDLELVYEIELDETGLFVWEDFRKGIYDMVVTKNGFNPIVLRNYEIADPNTFSWILEEHLLPVTNLHVTPSGYATWNDYVFEPFMETFDDGIPETWTIIDGGSTTDTWYMETPEGNPQTTGASLDGTPFAYVDSDEAGSGTTMDEFLVSPVIYALSSNRLFLHFDQFYNNLSSINEYAKVEVFDGSNWVTILTQNADAGAWNNADHKTLDVTEYMNEDFQVRFYYFSPGWYWWWAIDNVVLSETDVSERSLQNYKVWVDGIYKGNTTDKSWQHDLSNLVEEETYLTEVSAVYSTGESEKRSFLWTYYGCEYFAGPENLTVEVQNTSDVKLEWDMVGYSKLKLTQNPGAPANGYFQQYGYGYGVAYDLSAYPDALVNSLDFHHASWGVTGTWEYYIHIYDWDTKTLIETVGPITTTGNDIWEMGVELGDIATGGVSTVAILMEPLSNSPTDAYPDLSSDSDANPQGSIYGDLSNPSAIGSSTIGNFLMEMYIYTAYGPVRATPVNFDYVEAPAAQAKSAVNPVVEAPILIQEAINSEENDYVVGSNIYRDGVLIAEMVPGFMYVDENVGYGTYNYCVTHVYESGGESCLEDACIEVLVAENCNPPQSLSTTYNETNHVIDLTWETNVIEEWLFYDDGTNVDGIGGPASFSWAVKFDPDQLADYDGASLTKIAIYNRTAATDELRIYEGTNAATLLHTQSLDGLAVEAWAEVELTDAILIDVTKELWITVYTTDGVNYPAGCGPTQEVPNGDLITLDGVLWEHLSDYGLPYTWYLRGFVTNMAGATKALAPLDKPVAYPSAGQQQLLAISHQGSGSNNTIEVDGQRAMTHFQVYRNVNGGNFEVIDEVPFVENQTEYVYSDASIGNSAETYCYFITANYEYCGESDQSNEACVTLDPVCSPGWEPVPNLQYNMQLIGQIMIDDLVSLNANDIVGAFVGDECRGIASPMPDFNGLVFLSIGSNVASGEEVVLKIWNSNTCNECEAGTTVTFENMAEIGSIENPVAIACITDVDLTLSFGQGYTWFSENLAPEDAHPNSMFNGLEACNNDRLIGQSNFSVYYNGSWNGTITAMNPFYSYRMKLCAAQEFTATAPPAEITPIALNAGYTWLGYLPQACLPINDALANLSPAPAANDRLIGQNSFALFTGSSWLGSLTSLCPGDGYVIKLANASTLIYPEASANSSAAKLNQAPLNSPVGEYPATNLQHSMTILGQIELPSGHASRNPNDRVYAYINGQCVGMSNPMEAIDGLIFLSVGENSDETQKVSFRVWLDEQQQLFEVVDSLLFVPLKGEGLLNHPYIFSLGKPVNENTEWFVGEPYPNPFTEETVIPYTLIDAATIQVKIFNSSGQQITEWQEFVKESGKHQIHIPKGQLSRGLYNVTILITNEDRTIQTSKTIILM
jgi:subtilisin family serine protease